MSRPVCAWFRSVVQIAAFFAVCANAPTFAQDPLAGVTPPSSWLASAMIGNDDQRFVILDGATPADTDGLFPGQEVVTTQMTLDRVTWESPNAVVFGAARALSVSADLVGQLLANGSAVVVMGQTSPQGPWTWEPIDGGNKAFVPIAGPSRFVSPDIYDAYNLQPVGRPLAVRKQVVLLGCVATLAIGGAALLPTRRSQARWVVLFTTGIATLGLIAWAWQTEDVIRTQLKVIVVGKDVAQVDSWTFERSPGPTHVTEDPREMGYPVLHANAHERLAGLNVNSDALQYIVDRRLPMALLKRTVEPTAAVPVILDAVPFELRRVAALYQSPEVTAMGVTRSLTDENPVTTLWFQRQ